MRMFLIAVSLVMLFAGNAYADGNRVGIHFRNGGDIGFLYMGNDLAWTAGGSIGFSHRESEIESTGTTWDADSTKFSIFARKNFKLMENAYCGLGITMAFGFWDDVLGEAESRSIAPFFNVDYFLNKSFVLNAGAHIATFETVDYEWNGDDDYLTTDSVSFMDPYFGITYLF